MDEMEEHSGWLLSGFQMNFWHEIYVFVVVDFIAVQLLSKGRMIYSGHWLTYLSEIILVLFYTQTNETWT